MKTYRQKKQEYLSSGNNPLILEGMQISERLLEDSIRENLGPIANLLQSLRQITDTKKETRREELFEYLLGNPGTLDQVEKCIQTLINITRI